MVFHLECDFGKKSECYWGRSAVGEAPEPATLQLAEDCVVWGLQPVLSFATDIRGFNRGEVSVAALGVSMIKRISYPKDMKDLAKKDERSLVTVDVPGMMFQGPVDRETAKALLRWVTENIFKKGT